jgi:hypothetical protein
MALTTLPTAALANDAVDNTKLDLADNYAFTGTVTGAGGVNTPAFKAQLSSQLGPFTGNAWTDLSFGSELFDTSNAFDGTTFTVPETGKYYFASFIRLVDVNSANMYYQLQLNGASQNAISSIQTNGFDATVGFMTIGFSGIYTQNQNDNLKMRLFQSASVSSYIHTESWFCGFKIIE